ncbi:MFS transporter [Stackebrandtia nassauensis]|uniref:Major facilitator superfamily MFS_1 n=1 Tax=Stackebrandtia nassauensis (strain DSM 44728 / CIP 108903 / NRRL B-16338 / NBRC 102104 / LLR-40K-21) TaxID=446470 RepID=D3Q166_STANL|nr:MFS transporter [Stackebrandtia nassauensis]ADD45646.1 major facilitator superfamily MFS_1 [Stackebrandtia nassauensis DSM 44728]
MPLRVLPPAGAPRTLALAQLANAIGDGVFIVTSALYFSRIVGLPAGQIGLGLTVGWGLGALAGVPLGHLADRRGPRGVAAALAVATAASVAGLLLVRDFVPFLVVVCFYTCSQCGLLAARQALLAGLVDATERTKVRAYLQSTVNAGLAIGAGFGGLALYFDTEAAYLTVLGLDAAGFAVSALVLSRLPKLPPAPPRASGEPMLAVLRDRPYAVLTFLNGVLLLYMPLLSLVVPLWIVAHTAAPRWLVAATLVLNTASVMLFQVRVARGVTGPDSASRYVRLAGLIMAASCAAFALSTLGKSPWLAALVLLVAAGLQVWGEMTQASGMWEISFALAPSDKHGQYQGFFGSSTTMARMLGPVALTMLIVDWGWPGWLVLGGVFVAAGVAVGPVTRWAQRTRPAAEPERALG